MYKLPLLRWAEWQMSVISQIRQTPRSITNFTSTTTNFMKALATTVRCIHCVRSEIARSHLRKESNEFQERVARKVCKLNIDLQRYGLVAWTAGNVSERMSDGKRFMIKPSGVSYEDLKPSQMIICDLDGNVLEGELISIERYPHPRIYLSPYERCRRSCAHSLELRCCMERGTQRNSMCPNCDG